MSSGDTSVSPELMELIYTELHGLANSFMARERGDHTLQPTALVHEAFIRLVDKQDANWQSRGHFYALASKIMRSLLVDHARERGAKKRGGDRIRIPLEDRTVAPDATQEAEIDILDLHTAMDYLAQVDGELVQVVELRFFGGLTVKETAAALELPVRTIERRLQVANAWLREQLDG